MMQEQIWLRSLLLAVNQDPLGMVWQVVTPLKGTKTWKMLVKLGEMKKMVLSHMDRVTCRGMTKLEK
jgi:hypothetical protein